MPEVVATAPFAEGGLTDEATPAGVPVASIPVGDRDVAVCAVSCAETAEDQLLMAVPSSTAVVTANSRERSAVRAPKPVKIECIR